MTRHPRLLAPALVLLLIGSVAPARAAEIPFVRVVIAPVPPDGPDTKTVGDIDGDGFPDVIVASSINGGLYWYRYPAWTPHAIRTTGGWTTDMQAADVDGDGDLDIVIPGNGGLVWYRNPRPAGDPATAPWAEVLIGAAGANSHDLEVGDLNGDGKVDVVTRRHGGGGTYVWFQVSPTSWIQAVAGEDSGEGTALGDIDGDGDLDIAHNGFWLENPLPAGNPTAGPWPRHTIDSSWESLYVGVLVADINGDGRNDVVLAPSESSDGRFSWYEAANPKTGPWVEHVIDPSVSYFHTFKAADMDGDGDLDLVTAEMHQSSDPDEVSVYRNEGAGLAWTQQIVATTGSHNLRIADIDADGDIDIVGVNWHESAADGAAVTLWRNVSTAAEPPSLELTVEQAGLRPGDTLRVSAAVANPGAAVPVDVLFGVLLPPSPGCPGVLVAFMVDGLRAAEVGCLTGGPARLPALLRAVLLPGRLPHTPVPAFFEASLPADAGAGEYTLFLLLAAAGALDDGRIDPGDILAAATASFRVTP